MRVGRQETDNAVVRMRIRSELRADQDNSRLCAPASCSARRLGRGIDGLLRDAAAIADLRVQQ